MSNFCRLFLGLLARCFRSRRRLLLESLALRQQLTVLKGSQTRPTFLPFDRLFWVLGCRFWSEWKKSLLVVSPQTAVRWRRAGFRLYWSWISKASKQVGRKKLSTDLRALIFRMVAENPTWGAPRIHGELLMLGFEVSERTISRWMRRVPRDPQPALARVSCESPGRDCGRGLLHRPHNYLRRPLLLLCHRPRSPAYPAFQPQQASDQPLDLPAVAGGISVWGGSQISHP